jgi:hypothetical protein
MRWLLGFSNRQSSGSDAAAFGRRIFFGMTVPRLRRWVCGARRFGEGRAWRSVGREGGGSAAALQRFSADYLVEFLQNLPLC